jgi:hypothetical protein
MSLLFDFVLEAILWHETQAENYKAQFETFKELYDTEVAQRNTAHDFLLRNQGCC